MLKNTPLTTRLVIYHSNCKITIILIDSTIVNGFDIGRVYDNKNVYSEPEFFVAHLIIIHQTVSRIDTSPITSIYFCDRCHEIKKRLNRV